MRAKLESVERQTGIRPAQLDELKDLPESMVFLWRYFIDLHNRRTSNGFGVNPIQYSEILAYFTLLGLLPEDWELTAITRLDGVALEAFAKQAEKNKNKSKSKK